MSKDTGGPAFPQQVIRDGNGALQEVGVYGFSTGMTLRDYFAAHCPHIASATSWEDEAQDRYDYADAMLKERAK